MSEEKKTQTVEEIKETKDIKLTKKAEDIIEAVEKLSVLELSNLVKAMEDKFDVSAQAMQVAAVGAPVAAAEEEKQALMLS